MAASFPNELIIFAPTPGPEGLGSSQAAFLPVIVGPTSYPGDAYYPVGAVTRDSWTLLPPGQGGGWTNDRAAVCIPGGRGNSSGANSGASGIIGMNNTFARVSFWILRIDRVGAVTGAPPEIAISVRAGYGYLSQEIWAGTIISEDFGAPAGDALIVGIDNMPLCTQVEIWARVIPPEGTPIEDVPSVSLRFGICIDRGGGGPMDIKMGSWVVGAEAP